MRACKRVQDQLSCRPTRLYNYMIGASPLCSLSESWFLNRICPKWPFFAARATLQCACSAYGTTRSIPLTCDKTRHKMSVDIRICFTVCVYRQTRNEPRACCWPWDVVARPERNSAKCVSLTASTNKTTSQSGAAPC